MISAQDGFDVRCEWGLRGAEILAPVCDAVVVVDVLSFSTAVCVAVARGGLVFPYRSRDDAGATLAREVGAVLAGPRGSGGFSLSPASLRRVRAGERIVLPSPNGATISLATGATPTYVGCLRNARAVARAARRHGRRIGVVPAGERWPSDASLRPAFEDLVGAGAVVAELEGSRSPEARAAAWAFRHARESLPPLIEACASGRELAGRGYGEDVAIACELDADDVAPRLVDGAFVGGPPAVGDSAPDA